MHTTCFSRHRGGVHPHSHPLSTHPYPHTAVHSPVNTPAQVHARIHPHAAQVHDGIHIPWSSACLWTDRHPWKHYWTSSTLDFYIICFFYWTVGVGSLRWKIHRGRYWCQSYCKYKLYMIDKWLILLGFLGFYLNIPYRNLYWQMTFNYHFVDPGPDDISYHKRRYFALNVSIYCVPINIKNFPWWSKIQGNEKPPWITEPFLQ